MHSAFLDNFVKTSTKLKQRPALVLNADYRPLSYFPLSLWCWQDAIKASYCDRVDIVAEYDEIVHSPSVEIRIPSVIVLKDFVKPRKMAPFTRFNLFLRDGFTCQYCGRQGDMTFDHVIPRARGGRTTWGNVVASCGPCNLRKGARSVRDAGFNLLRKPCAPSSAQLMNIGRKFPPNHLHDSWIDFLYWDAELEE
tara:strand:- start:20771 stop:21355 length:585 start_codon:yes stop_codon:yes gene_type:complete